MSTRQEGASHVINVYSRSIPGSQEEATANVSEDGQALSWGLEGRPVWLKHHERWGVQETSLEKWAGAKSRGALRVLKHVWIFGKAVEAIRSLREGSDLCFCDLIFVFQDHPNGYVENSGGVRGEAEWLVRGLLMQDPWETAPPGGQPSSGNNCSNILKKCRKRLSA